MAASYTRCVSYDRLDAMLSLLERLVEQNSHSFNPAGLASVGDLIATELEAIEGISVRRVDDHIVAMTEAARDSADGCVGLVGHLDTVFPPGTFEGFRRDGDLVRGPGVLDMKGGLVVCIEALRSVSASIPVRLVIVADEEIGSRRGGPVLEESLRGAACALVFEGGRAADAIITARKGTGDIRVVVRGRAAHAGNHHADGANAIWALAKLIDKAQSLTDYDRGLTVNAGTIEGGESRNTVPDHAKAAFDLRFMQVEDGIELAQRIREAAREVQAAVPGTRIEVTGGVVRAPLHRTPANVALYEEYAACAAAAGLGDGECPQVGGGSDASTTAAIGIPSIDGLGPRGGGFHTKDEWIDPSTLSPRAEALVRFLKGRATFESTPFESTPSDDENLD